MTQQEKIELLQMRHSLRLQEIEFRNSLKVAKSQDEMPKGLSIPLGIAVIGMLLFFFVMAIK